MGSEDHLTERQKAMGRMFDAMLGVGQLYLENWNISYHGTYIRRIKHYNPNRRGPDVTVFEFVSGIKSNHIHWRHDRCSVKRARRRKHDKYPLSRGFLKYIDVEEAKYLVHEYTEDENRRFPGLPR